MEWLNWNLLSHSTNSYVFVAAFILESLIVFFIIIFFNFFFILYPKMDALYYLIVSYK